MRKDALVSMSLAKHIEGKKVSEKQQVIYLTSMCQWMVHQGVGRKVKSKKKIARKDRKLWRYIKEVCN